MTSNPKRIASGKPDMPQPFHARLATLLELRGMNQSDLARAVWGEVKNKQGLMVARNRDRISQYLAGKSNPEPDNLRRMAKALGVKPEELAPDLVAEAIRGTKPEVAFHAVSGHPDKVVLTINTIVPMQLAVKIVGDLASAGARTH